MYKWHRAQKKMQCNAWNLAAAAACGTWLSQQTRDGSVLSVAVDLGGLTLLPKESADIDVCKVLVQTALRLLQFAEATVHGSAWQMMLQEQAVATCLGDPYCLAGPAGCMLLHTFHNLAAVCD